MLNKADSPTSRIYSKLRENIYPIILLICSLAVYATQYHHPRAMFWDENYHIASAQKHIDHVMYMEPHPPLGKMLMGASDALMGTNSTLDMHKLNETDYIKGEDAPSGMRYSGFRLPSVVLMAFSVLFFFGILNRITQHKTVAFLFTSLIIFNNSLVIQARSAMLEGIQMFFILWAIYYWARIITDKKTLHLRQYAILGLIIGLAVSVKVNAFILLLLFVMLFAVDQFKNLQKRKYTEVAKRLAVTAPAGVGALALVFLSVFYIHIGMGTKVIDQRTYKASPEYLEAIRLGHTWRPSTFVTALQDHLKYSSEYADGAPRLEECKDGENGSSPIDWPLGKKSINFRWDKDTENGVVEVRYLQLVAHPIIFFSVVAGIILSLGLIMSKFIYGNKEKDTPLFYWICAFTTLYVCYMIAIMRIERVMYLYHYLVPLVFGCINLALVFSYIYREEILANQRHMWINLGAYVALIMAVFFFFMPFTYAIGMTEDQFEMRNWFSFWKMAVVH